MIYDEMKNLNRYKGICKQLDMLIDVLVTNDAWKNMKMGKTAVDGEKIFINHDCVNLIPERTVYEMHHCYADLQIELSGGETIYRAPADQSKWPHDGNETEFAQGPEGTEIHLMPGEFVIFFPWDAHMPIRGKGQCEKLVGKFYFCDK